MEYFSLHEKGRRIGPVARRNRNSLTTLRQPIILNSGKRTRPCDARYTCVPELVPGSGVKACRADGGLPFAVGRARMLAATGNIPAVLHLERFYCASHADHREVLDRIPHLEIADRRFRSSGPSHGRTWTRSQMGGIELISHEVPLVQGKIVGVVKLQRDRVPATNSPGQRDAEKS